MLKCLMEHVLSLPVGIPILGAVVIVELLEGWMGFVVGGPIIIAGCVGAMFIAFNLPPVQREV